MEKFSVMKHPFGKLEVFQHGSSVVSFSVTRQYSELINTKQERDRKKVKVIHFGVVTEILFLASPHHTTKSLKTACLL